MNSIKNISEAILLLKDGYVITKDNKDFFVYKNDRIHHYYDGNHYSLTVEEFMKLYNKNSFYYYEETVVVDETKDEDYYRYYKK